MSLYSQLPIKELTCHLNTLNLRNKTLDVQVIQVARRISRYHNKIIISNLNKRLMEGNYKIKSIVTSNLDARHHQKFRKNRVDTIMAM